MKKNTKQKIRLAVLCGGKSAEHDVSIVSARNIINAIDRRKYTITVIHIDREGHLSLIKEKDLAHDHATRKRRGHVAIPFMEKNKFFLCVGAKKQKIDVVFPALHGPFGEDGTMQGLLRLYNVPFVGPSVLGSAIGMDKDVAKRLLRDAGLPVADFMVFNHSQKKDFSFRDIVQRLDLPLFVKPANLGSSVGISKVKNEKEFARAIRTAFAYDKKIIIERYIEGREIECSVMGDKKLIASVPGEIMPSHEFYSYEAKYIDDGAVTTIPADLPVNMISKIQHMAVRTCETLCCDGMGRVDFFVTKKNEIYINEINTIPGFTSISMFPKLWEASGIPYHVLIDKLISYAIKRHEEENKLRTIR